MAKRMIVMLAVTFSVIALLGFVKFRQIQTAMAQGAPFQPPPEAVTTVVAQTEHWPATLSAIGTIAAVQGVTVSADLPGTVARVAFESGRSVRKGDVLAELDTRQERAQLVATLRDRSRMSRVRYAGGIRSAPQRVGCRTRSVPGRADAGADQEGNQLLAVVQLYRALGGGWQQ